MRHDSDSLLKETPNSIHVAGWRGRILIVVSSTHTLVLRKEVAAQPGHQPGTGWKRDSHWTPAGCLHHSELEESALVGQSLASQVEQSLVYLVGHCLVFQVGQSLVYLAGHCLVYLAADAVQETMNGVMRTNYDWIHVHDWIRVHGWIRVHVHLQKRLNFASVVIACGEESEYESLLVVGCHALSDHWVTWRTDVP